LLDAHSLEISLKEENDTTGKATKRIWDFDYVDHSNKRARVDAVSPEYEDD
jgi:hypothetical protein